MRTIGIVPFTETAAIRVDARAMHNEQRTAAKNAPASTAVIPVAAPSGDRSTPRHGRPDAAFVVQLIATATHAPQTRPLRRAQPSDAVTRYRIARDTPTKSTPVRFYRTA